MLRTLGMRVGARVSLVLARSLRLLHSVCLNLSNLPCMYEHTATYCSVRAFGFRLSRVIRSPVGDQLSLSSRYPFSCSLKQEVLRGSAPRSRPATVCPRLTTPIKLIDAIQQRTKEQPKPRRRWHKFHENTSASWNYACTHIRHSVDRLTSLVSVRRRGHVHVDRL